MEQAAALEVLTRWCEGGAALTGDALRLGPRVEPPGREGLGCGWIAWYGLVGLLVIAGGVLELRAEAWAAGAFFVVAGVVLLVLTARARPRTRPERRTFVHVARDGGELGKLDEQGRELRRARLGAPALVARVLADERGYVAVLDPWVSARERRPFDASFRGTLRVPVIS
ncbi:MAG: hypothetical protein AB7N76_34545 [Planctomycetota bacterium]